MPITLPAQRYPLTRLPESARRPLALLARFRTCEAGATAIEYGLIVTLIGLTMVSVWLSGGERLSDGFQRISDKL